MSNTRRNDPVTSREAGESVKNMTATQAHILRLLMRRSRTDTQLIDAFEKDRRAPWAYAPYASESGIRSRRAELVRRGLVVDTGLRKILVSGRRSIVWGVAV